LCRRFDSVHHHKQKDRLQAVFLFVVPEPVTLTVALAFIAILKGVKKGTATTRVAVPDCSRHDADYLKTYSLHLPHALLVRQLTPGTWARICSDLQGTQHLENHLFYNQDGYMRVVNGKEQGSDMQE
jgi:hypothetical protein